jgi:5-formyltetrahydrofolate cyclo-ligase
MNSKTELRKLFRARLGEAAGSREFVQSCEKLGERLENYLAKTLSESAGPERRGVWAAFQPTGFEADVRSLFKGSRLLNGIEWAFPRVEGDSLAFYVPRETATFTLNRWGILEPDSGTEIKGLLVPGLAFDLNCNRLGRGGGFYDRFLDSLLKSKPVSYPTPLKVGVALDLQVSEQAFSVETFDVPMDRVVTETRILERSPATPVCPDRKSERKTS